MAGGGGLGIGIVLALVLPVASAIRQEGLAGEVARTRAVDALEVPAAGVESISRDAFRCQEGVITEVRMPASSALGRAELVHRVLAHVMPPPALPSLKVYVDKHDPSWNFIVFPPMPGETSEWRMIAQKEVNNAPQVHRQFILGDRHPCA
mmetsp:Transcript_95602/g.276149  ORF Transcript_95602/g.276149 Transcript_95602/m.276149 type:complete len:150 (-) Transcript_95602:84-533(-)